MHARKRRWNYRGRDAVQGVVPEVHKKRIESYPCPLLPLQIACQPFRESSGVKFEEMIVKIVKIYRAPFAVNTRALCFDLCPGIVYPFYVFFDIVLLDFKSYVVIGALCYSRL